MVSYVTLYSHIASTFVLCHVNSSVVSVLFCKPVKLLVLSSGQQLSLAPRFSPVVKDFVCCVSYPSFHFEHTIREDRY